MLENGNSSLWLCLLNVLVATRENFLWKVGKFFDWLMNRKKKHTSAGRPTIDDFWLGTHRDSLVDMLSCWWGEVGWQLPRATTREELRAALEPLREHPNRHRISRLVFSTPDFATAEQIREERRADEDALAQIYKAHTKQRE